MFLLIDHQSSLRALIGGKEKGNLDTIKSYLLFYANPNLLSDAAIQSIVFIVVQDLNDILALLYLC